MFRPQNQINMTPEEIINEISEWANASHAYLSNREGYPRGYRNGISQAKVIILDILSKAHRISEEDKLFPIIGITKQELEDNGFDTSKLDESYMLTMADKIKDALNDNGYQDILNIVAEECMNIPRKINTYCPMCRNKNVGYNHSIHQHECYSCGQAWDSNLYVLVDFPEDTLHFEDNAIGYPCFTSEDNGARYVTEFDYINQFKRKPEPEQYFCLIQWPNSQPYFELSPEKQKQCEPVLYDEKTISDFGSSAIWVPFLLIESQS